MFGSDILEVAIGLIFVYILVSILCSSIREGLEAWLKTRAAYLEHGIRELLHDRSATGIAQSVYQHPLIASLYSGDYKPGKPGQQSRMLARGGELPSYIPARNFALALMDIAARGPRTDVVSSDPNSPPISLESVRLNILNIQNPQVQRALLAAIDSAQGSLDRAVANVAAWYDSAMDRVSGWYKRSTHWILFWIGLVLAAALNINTITIVDFLYRDDAARQALVARAETVATDTTFLKRTYAETRQELESLALPVGWTEGWGAPRRGDEPGSTGAWNDWVAPILGWLLTALAATMGAPFWFDLLNRVMVIRSTVKPREKSPEEGSEDRQPRPTAQPAAAAQPMGVGASSVLAAGPSPAAADPSMAFAAQPPPAIATPMDAESDIDACDAMLEAPASDDEQPGEEGGVG